MAMSPDQVKLWRREERTRLIAQRVGVPDEMRETWTSRIIAHLEPIVTATDGPVSFYWPFRGEPNLRPLMRRLVAAGKSVALPVVVQQRRPLEFRPWTPGCEMEFGVWNIPIPNTPVRVTPRLLLAPVVGFDRALYRLGYGGGFFDRTLADLRGPRVAIGVGYDSQAIETVHPLAHDIPMDRIVTESGFVGAGARDSDAELSSPACLLAEAPDAYAGYLDEAEIAAELQALRASSVASNEALARALDRTIEQLPKPAGAGARSVGNEPVSIADRVAQLRARVRDDALHAALGEILDLARIVERR